MQSCAAKFMKYSERAGARFAEENAGAYCVLLSDGSMYSALMSLRRCNESGGQIKHGRPNSLAYIYPYYRIICSASPRYLLVLLHVRVHLTHPIQFALLGATAERVACVGEPTTCAPMYIYSPAG